MEYTEAQKLLRNDATDHTQEEERQRLLAGLHEQHAIVMYTDAASIRIALCKAVEENMTSLLILADCKMIVDRINHECHGLTSLDVIIEDIRRLSQHFWKCSFLYIRREMNMCSHGLAKLAINLLKETRWNQSFPVWLNRDAHNNFLKLPDFC